MTATRVFLDTGIFIALMNGRDRHHAQAKAMFGGLRPCWYTSILVRSEAYSWFLHKHGEEAARSFRFMLDCMTGLRVLDADSEHHVRVCEVLDRLRGTKLTYVDASSLALMAQHKIRLVWATDYHLGLTGAEVLPRS